MDELGCRPPYWTGVIIEEEVLMELVLSAWE